MFRELVIALCTAASIAAVSYGHDQLSYISAREEMILDVLVERLSQETGESEISIWRRVQENTGASSQLTIRHWDYSSVLSLIADDLAKSKQDNTKQSARQQYGKTNTR